MYFPQILSSKLGGHKKHLIISCVIISNLLAQELESAMAAWNNIMQTPEIVEYFHGVFDKLGITVEGMDDKFTVHHQGDKITFSKGIDDDIDFLVPLKKQNILNMISHSKDGSISPEESWRILSVLFTPLTYETLKVPTLAVNWRRKLAGVEDLIHIYLLTPAGGKANKHILIYVKNQWLVIEGLYGNPRRTYRMTPGQSLEYQRCTFTAIKKDSFWEWWRFATWYKEWRKTCSVTHT